MLAVFPNSVVIQYNRCLPYPISYHRIDIPFAVQFRTSGRVRSILLYDVHQNIRFLMTRACSYRQLTSIDTTLHAAPGLADDEKQEFV